MVEIPIGPFIKWAIDLLTSLVKGVFTFGKKRRAEKLISAAMGELIIKSNPALNRARVLLETAEMLLSEPNEQLENAKQLLRNAEEYHRVKSGLAEQKSLDHIRKRIDRELEPVVDWWHSPGGQQRIFLEEIQQLLAQDLAYFNARFLEDAGDLTSEEVERFVKQLDALESSYISVIKRSSVETVSYYGEKYRQIHVGVTRLNRSIILRGPRVRHGPPRDDEKDLQEEIRSLAFVATQQGVYGDLLGKYKREYPTAKTNDWFEQRARKRAHDRLIALEMSLSAP